MDRDREISLKFLDVGLAYRESWFSKDISALAKKIEKQ